MTAMERSCRVGAVVVLTLGLAACTTTGPERVAPTGPVVQLGAPGDPNHTLSPDEAMRLESPTHVEADSQFMLDMIQHHNQAIVMTEFVDERTDDRDIRLLAERMKVSQEDELKLMIRWLQDRVIPLRDDREGHSEHDGDEHAMPGMLTDDQLARLEAATGAEFERLFLEYMIQHHQGAVQMVDELYAAGGGHESDIDQFARHVESDQGIEIARMQQMLAERSVLIPRPPADVEVPGGHEPPGTSSLVGRPAARPPGPYQRNVSASAFSACTRSESAGAPDAMAASPSCATTALVSPGPAANFSARSM